MKRIGKGGLSEKGEAWGGGVRKLWKETAKIRGHMRGSMEP